MAQLHRSDALGPFIVEKKISSGGMATVYLCRPATPMSGFPPHVAVKVAKEGFEDFLRDEEDHLRHLQHPNIIRPVPIPFVTEDSERKQYARCTTSNGATLWYLVLEHLEGGSLADLLQIKKRLPAPLATEIASQIAMALDHLHRVRGVAHLDVRPDNILFRQDPLNSKGKPEVILCDFGISWRVQKSPEESYGDVPYVAPERRHGSQVTESCDIYSLGVVLYEMLTGRRPYPQDEKESNITDAASYPVSPEPPSKHRGVSSHLDTVVQRAIARVPGDRYATASGFLEDLAPIRLELVAKSGPIKGAWRRVSRWAVSFLSISLLASVLVIAGRPVLGDWIGQALSAILPQVVATPSDVAPGTITITSPLEATEVAQLPTDTPEATNTPVLETDIPVPSDTALPAEPPDLVATEVAVKRAAAATLTAEAPTPTSMPTDTPVPPTDTPAPPTDTPVPPTNTPPPITNTPKPTPKPKMGKILFTSNRVSWDDIFVMNDDGSEVKQLTKIGMCYNAHFSPDGKRIVFDHDGDIWAMNADGSGQRNLTNTADTVEAFPVFSSDSAQIAYLYAWSQGFQIYTMKADGSGQKAITSESLDWMPAWQPGGNRIAFSSARSGLFNIWTVKSDGSGLKQVTTFSDFGAVSPVWSPDGKQIGMVRYAGNSWEIWAVNADGSNPRRVTQIVGGDDGFVPDMGGWKKGKFVFGAYHGNWDVASVPEMGGNTAFLSDNPKDDKPTDWWLP